MLQVTSFTFNPFSENTYVVSNEKGKCIIFDPGMYQSSEESQLHHYITQSNLKPVALINTHCHIDHIFGNAWLSNKYGLKLQAHALERQVLEMGKRSAEVYGLNYTESVDIEILLSEKDQIKLDDDVLDIFFTPGHSPGSLSFYSRKDHFIISGDVLFQQSIGRTDLPGGDYQTLIDSIKTQLLVLPEDTVVYSGHGDTTTIGSEKRLNPFLND